MTLPKVNKPAPRPLFPAFTAPPERVVAGILATMLVLVPVAGIPSELVLQDTLKSTLVACCTLIAVITWIFMVYQQQCKTGRGPALRWHGLLVLPMVLCLYALGSMLWSHTYLAAVEATRWAVLGLLFWITQNIARRTTLPLLVWGVHAGALGASVWAAAQFWGDFAWFPQAAPPAATFVNRNFFAEYLVCTLPFSVLALVQLQNTRWRQLMALSVAFNIVALMMTGTRSALLALWVLTPLLSWMVWRYRDTLAIGRWSVGSKLSVVLVFASAVFALGSLPSQSVSIQQEGNGVTALQRSVLRTASLARPNEYTVGSFSVRASMWKSTARMLMDRPWSGVGAGAWEVHIPLYQGWNNSVETDFYAHNEYLQLLSEYGFVIGGGCLAVLLAYLLMCAQSTLQWGRDGIAGRKAAFNGFALSSILALLIVSNAGFPWRLASTGALWMVVLGMLASTIPLSHRHKKVKRRQQPVSPLALRLGLVALLLASALTAAISWQAMQAERLIVGSIHTLNAMQKNTNMPETEREAGHTRALAMLQQGVAINPHYRKLTSLAADQMAASGDRAGALWALQSVATSRPNVPDIQANLTILYSERGQQEQAMEALKQLQRLQPDAPRTRALGVLLQRRTGQDAEAAVVLRTYFAKGLMEYDLVRFALAIGLEHPDAALAAQAFGYWTKGWPEEKTQQAALLTSTPSLRAAVKVDGAAIAGTQNKSQ